MTTMKGSRVQANKDARGRMPSFQNVIRGAGSILDLWPDNTRRYRRYTAGSDAERLCGDWVFIGSDIRRAVTRYGEKAKKQLAR